MMPEKFLFVDENNNELIINSDKNSAFKLLWKRASGGFVLDPFSLKLLCHKRAKVKSQRPNVWVCTFGGKARLGESSFDTAARELFEEYQLIPEGDHIHYLGLFRSEARNQFEYIYVVLQKEYNVIAEKRNEEVDEMTWIKINEIVPLLSNSSDWYSYGHEKYFLNKILQSIRESDYFKSIDESYFNHTIQALKPNSNLSAIIEDNIIKL